MNVFWATHLPPGPTHRAHQEERKTGRMHINIFIRPITVAAAAVFLQCFHNNFKTGSYKFSDFPSVLFQLWFFSFSFS